MRHLAWLVVGSMLLGTRPAQAQLEPIGVPKGTLRFALTGEFTSYDTRFLNGTEQDYLADFSRPALGSSFWPELLTADTTIGAIIGNPYSLNLGRQQVNGIANVTPVGLNFALGVTSRLTIFANVPIVTTRVQAKFALDSTSGDAGFNPAHPTLGTAAGQAAAAQFFLDFDQALGTLDARIQSGFYGSDSALEAHAAAVLLEATTLRNRLERVSNDQLTASPFLPDSTSTAGQAILSTIGALKDTLENSSGLNIPGFSTTVPLPLGRLSTDDFKNFVANPLGPVAGFPLRESMISRLGDVQLGAAYTLIDRWDRGKRLGGFRAVAQATVVLPTGYAENPADFLDIGTGNKRYELGGALTADLGYRRWGARLNGNYQRRFSSDRLLRVSPPDQPIPFKAREARVTLNPGDLLSLSAQPFFRLAPQLALTAGVNYWRERAGSASYLAASDIIAGLDANVLTQQSARSATSFTAGITYVGRAAHECRAGKCGLPIDATLMYERVLSAMDGRVPGAETVRAAIRFYQRLW